MRSMKAISIALLALLLSGTAIAQKSEKTGGEVIIKAKRDQATLVSPRFSCSSCKERVIRALKAERGVTDVRVEGDKPPINVVVRFDPQKTNARRIGLIAKRALEAEPHDRAPVKLRYERED